MFKAKISQIQDDKNSPYKYEMVLGKGLRYGLFKDCLSVDWPKFVGKKVSIFVDSSKASVIKILTSTGKRLYPTTGEYKTVVEKVQ